MNALDCASCEALLSARLDRPLANEEREALEAHLAGCAECRRAEEEYEKLARDLEQALRAAPLRVKFSLPPETLPAVHGTVQPSARLEYARRGVATAGSGTWSVRAESSQHKWLVVACAGAAATLACALALWFWLARGVGSPDPSPQIAETPNQVPPGGIEHGRRHEGGREGATLALADGGSLKLEAGAEVLREERSWVLLTGRLRARSFSALELQLGGWGVKTARASVALDRLVSEGREELAVVALSGRARVRVGGGERELAPRQILVAGWGPEVEAAQAAEVEQLAAMLRLRLEALPPPEEAAKYREIISQFDGRLAEFRRLQKEGRLAAPEAHKLGERETSLADCREAHQLGLVKLELALAERKQLGRRIEFLECVRQWMVEESPPSSDARPSAGVSGEAAAGGATVWDAPRAEVAWLR